MTTELELHRTDSSDARFQSLIDLLSSFLAEINGDQNEFYVQHNRTDKIRHVIVAELDGVPIGCGAIRATEDDSVEIKRMFVVPRYRGKRVGAKVLEELELWAYDLGYRRTVLETSKRLHAAVHLYRTAGYREIANFEPYVGIEDSVCMEKILYDPAA